MYPVMYIAEIFVRGNFKNLSSVVCFGFKEFLFQAAFATPRGAKHCRLFSHLNCLLTFFGSRHVRI